jgi:endonuclease/exonuclease/phosphatase family metal-dependent hydrolase
MKMTLLILGSALLIIILALAWAGYPWSLHQQKLPAEIVHVEPKEMMDYEEYPSVLRVLTWNLGFLYGEGSEGPGYEPRPQSFFTDKLDRLAQEIKAMDVDVLCLQEVDFDSHRSHSLNQAQYLASKAGYPYVAEAVSWHANYIPFPHWPLTHHFGEMKSGGAILSKYPILTHEVTLLAKPLSQPWWYNIFYLHRYFQEVQIEVGELKFKIINLHLEAFDKVDRVSQIDQLKARIQSEKIDFVTGDFNMVPKSAMKKRKFFNGDDYENDASFEKMENSGLDEVIPNSIYAQDEARYFTFPAWAPDRRLDYIFFSPAHKMLRAEVLPSALSDHLPLKALFQVAEPHFNPYSQ